VASDLTSIGVHLAGHFSVLSTLLVLKFFSLLMRRSLQRWDNLESQCKPATPSKPWSADNASQAMSQTPERGEREQSPRVQPTLASVRSGGTLAKASDRHREAQTFEAKLALSQTSQEHHLLGIGTPSLSSSITQLQDTTPESATFGSEPGERFKLLGSLQQAVELELREIRSLF
jgi:hypothetical protein